MIASVPGVLVWANFGWWIHAMIGNRIGPGNRLGPTAEELLESLHGQGYHPYEDGSGVPRLSTWFRADIAPAMKVVWIPDRTEATVVKTYTGDGPIVVVSTPKHRFIHLDEDDFRMNCLLPVEVAAMDAGMSVEQYAKEHLNA